MKHLLILFIFVFSSLTALAAPKKLPIKKVSSSEVAGRPIPQNAGSSGQNAIVKTDSAIVYDQPSFDGSSISYLPAGQRVRISTRTYGTDVGLFYMIRLPNKKVGYIADIDVHPIKSKNKKSKKHADEDTEADSSDQKSNEEDAKDQAKEEAKKQKEEEVKKAKEAKKQREEEQDEEEQRRHPKEPMMYKPWIGPYVASWGFKEKISGVKAEDRILVYGLKYTTPKLLTGTLLDLNLGFHFGAPKYYDQLSVGKPSGYIMFLDAEFLSPMIMAEDSFGYFGIGPLINYTSIRVKSIGGAPVDSNDLRLGAALTLGYSHRLGPVRAALEGKYIIEKTQQLVLVGSVQMSF